MVKNKNKVDKGKLCAIVKSVIGKMKITIVMIKFSLLVVASYLVIFAITSDQEQF